MLGVVEYRDEHVELVEQVLHRLVGREGEVVVLAVAPVWELVVQGYGFGFYLVSEWGETSGGLVGRRVGTGRLPL